MIGTAIQAMELKEMEVDWSLQLLLKETAGEMNLRMLCLKETTVG